MKKKKNNFLYTFDEDTLSYKPLVLTTKKKVMRSFKWLLSSCIFGIVSFVCLLNIIDSPKERNLKRELEFMKFNYENISKKIDLTDKVLQQIRKKDNDLYRAILEVSPKDEDIMIGGFGGINRYSGLLGYHSSQIVQDISKKTDLLMNRLYLQSKSLEELTMLVKDKEKMLDHIPAIQPVDDGISRLVSGFGYRFHPILKQKKMHYGVDFAAHTGTPIYATGNAVVKLTGFSAGYGKYIVLDHGFGYETLYAHLDKIGVQRFSKVKRGQKIGEMGNTGLSSGTHLHYEIHKGGVKVDPINYYYKDLTPEQYKLMVEKSEQSGQTLD